MPAAAAVGYGVSFARRHPMLVLLVLLAPVLVFLAPLAFIALIVAGGGASSSAAISTSDGCAPAGPLGAPVNVANVSVEGLSPSQLQIAGDIVRTVQSRPEIPRHLKSQAGIVALATSLQESTLSNPGPEDSDRDSAGPFQQRPSTGWGTYPQVRNTPLATQAFLGVAKHTDNGGLLDIPRWHTLPVTVAAQEVQASAYPSAYADDEPTARAIWNKLAGEVGTVPVSTGCVPPTAAECPPTGLAVEKGLTPDALRVVRCVDLEFGRHVYLGVGDRGNVSDHPDGKAVDVMIDRWQTGAGNAHGWKIARWVQRNAARLGVTYVIWDAKIWSVERKDEGWRVYSHPSGGSDPTLDHLDHLHVSVHGNAGGATSSGKYVLPVAPGQYILSSGFGECSDLWESCHTGQDFDTSNSADIPLRAVGDGVVAEVEHYCGSPSSCPYGNQTILKLAGESQPTEVMYAHQVRFAPGISPGSRVRAGQVIGWDGTTGNSTGDHLHFEVIQSGQQIDPMPWLRARGLKP